MAFRLHKALLVLQSLHLRSGHLLGAKPLASRPLSATLRNYSEQHVQQVAKTVAPEQGEEQKQPPRPPMPKPSPIKRLMRVKDYVDFLFLCFLGGGVYYGYSQYQKNKVHEVEQEIEWVELPDVKDKHVKVKDYYLPSFTAKLLKEVKNFQVRSDDVWIASFPKSGTTWLQEIVYLIVSDCDFVTAKAKSIEERVPYLEFPMPGITYVKKMATDKPRLIKTHFPLSFLPDNIEKQCKVIYILRNPKDVAVSYFHYIRMFTNFSYTGSFDDFVKMFVNGQLLYGPWWRHVDEYCAKDANVHIVYYEDLQEKPVEVIKSLCKYLGKELSDDKIKSIVQHCSFDSMKQNKSVNYDWWQEMGIFKKGSSFFRKGQVGDWLGHFSRTESIELDQAVKANLKSKHEFNYGISGQDLEKIYGVSSSNKPDQSK